MTLWPNGTKNQPDISTGYGGYPGHNGTDFINFDYNRATDDGVVVYAGWNPSGAGYEVRIQHSDYISRYLHNTPDMQVSFGQNVSAGQIIGIQGMTGDATGKHLHYEVWPGGNINNRTDPVPYLQMRIASTAGGGSTPFPNEMDDDMKVIYNLETGELALLGGGKGFTSIGKRDTLTPGYESFLNLAWGSTLDLTDTQFKVNRDYALKTAAVAGNVSIYGATKAEIQAISDASDVKVIAAQPKYFTATMGK